MGELPKEHEARETPVERRASEVIQETGFQDAEKIYQAGTRNVIYSGVYDGKPAVLKVYDDYRLNDEAASQQRFLETNRSTILSAPEVYAAQTISPHAGWLIMEKLEGGSFFRPPLADDERSELIDVYVEYRMYFDRQPSRPLNLQEQLSSADYHQFRIDFWLHRAVEAEAKRRASGDEPVLEASSFRPRYEQAMKVIRDTYADGEMTWGHGHFKPQDIYKVGPGRYYLTDFGHTKMHPEGYELAFIVWADSIIHGDWQLPYGAWKKGIDRWVEMFRKRSDELIAGDFDQIMRASLLERTIGTIIADIPVPERPADEQRKRLALAYALIDELSA